MDNSQKQLYLKDAREHLKCTIEAVHEEIGNVKERLESNERDFKTNKLADRGVYENFKWQCKKRFEELDTLKHSPYFSLCEVEFEGDTKKRTIYFSKFQFMENEIYSWVAPAASIRFNEPGFFSFKRPDGRIQNGILERKNQYMIVDGKIVFLATESINNPRELIHQEHFSMKRSGFILPEIVAQMEKAQDQVIRADHRGSFVISGPAGSGKTTLALHRVAYLAQSPEIMHLYEADSIIIFVQDESTKNYFSHLLPELGIQNVEIVTFSHWAMKILEINNANNVVNYGSSEEEREEFEYEKLKVLRNKNLSLPRYNASPFNLLDKLYKENLPKKYSDIFNNQAQNFILDRIDLTFLLEIYKKTHGGIKPMQEHYVEMKNGRLKRKKERLPLDYCLAVIDEFQNYLPEQLSGFNDCVRKSTQSIVYVGELAQQINLGTIKKWEEIDENIADERLVTLQKVYRNTKNILNYIKNLGYDIEVPEALREGNPVVEKKLNSKQDEISYIQQYIAGFDEEKMPSIGIIAKSEEYLNEFKEVFGNNEKVHILSIRQSQGVEFESVFLVGIQKDTFIAKDVDVSESAELFAERKNIQKNLLYIALTRAMNELYVLGGSELC